MTTWMVKSASYLLFFLIVIAMACATILAMILFLPFVAIKATWVLAFGRKKTAQPT